jgi:hypothetical protein
MVYVLSFYTNHVQFYFFHETLRTHMDYGDVHVKFLFKFFDTSKYVFLA